MPTYTIESTGEKINLSSNEFLAQGGEGSIYQIGNRIHKICEAGKMIPREKFKELLVLKRPNIIMPDDIILYRNKPVGYSMPAVPKSPMPLAQILTKSFRKREGVTHQQIASMVLQIADGIRFIHSKPGYLQVDGNEYNYMVTNDFNEVYFIDTNSFQTPSFPADAIMPSIRDWHVKVEKGRYLFTQDSDWYSFGIIAWYLFTAIHAFRGIHPSFTNKQTFMEEQMKACKSVLDPEVQFPIGATFYPFEDYIPGGKDGAYMQWFKRIFIKNERLPAPLDYQAAIKFAIKIKEIIGSDKFKMEEIRRLVGQVTAYYQKGPKEVVVADKLYLGGKETALPAERFRVGFSEKYENAFACWIENESVKLKDLRDNTDINITLFGKNVMSCEGRVYVQGENNIFEIKVLEIAGRMLATPIQSTSVSPLSTKIYQGVVVQNAFNSFIVSIFPQAGSCVQFPMKELNDYRILDAKYEGGVLMVIGNNKESGHYDRMIFRFSKNWNSYELSRKIENITPAGLNFTVIDNGLCVCITEEEKVEIFSSTKGQVDVKSIVDPAIRSDMHLCHKGNQILFAKDNRIYSMSMR